MTAEQERPEDNSELMDEVADAWADLRRGVVEKTYDHEQDDQLPDVSQQQNVDEE